jgi:hypothetical protein
MKRRASLLQSMAVTSPNRVNLDQKRISLNPLTCLSHLTSTLRSRIVELSFVIVDSTQSIPVVRVESQLNFIRRSQSMVTNRLRSVIAVKGGHTDATATFKNIGALIACSTFAAKPSAFNIHPLTSNYSPKFLNRQQTRRVHSRHRIL